MFEGANYGCGRIAYFQFCFSFVSRHFRITHAFALICSFSPSLWRRSVFDSITFNLSPYSVGRRHRCRAVVIEVTLPSPRPVCKPIQPSIPTLRDAFHSSPLLILIVILISLLKLSLNTGGTRPNWCPAVLIISRHLAFFAGKLFSINHLPLSHIRVN